MTLREAYERHYLQHQTELTHRSKSKIRCHLSRWEQLSRGPDGDSPNPDAAIITRPILLAFRSRLLDAGFSTQTANAHIATVMSLLRHIGPPCRGFPHGLNLLPSVPWIGRPLRDDREPRQPASLEQLGACYRAAKIATWPGPDAPGWWRAWFVTAYNTGLRREDSLSIQRASINESFAWFTIRASKTGKLQYLPIHPALRRHWQPILDRTADPLVLPTRVSTGPIAWTRFYGELRVIAAAGRVAPPCPQSIRRLAGVQYELAHSGAGALLLGHTTVTSRHYIGALRILTEAAEKIPQIPGSDEARGQLLLFG